MQRSIKVVMMKHLMNAKRKAEVECTILALKKLSEEADQFFKGIKAK